MSIQPFMFEIPARVIHALPFPDVSRPAFEPYHVVERKLLKREGREGDRNDPYQFVEREARVNGNRYTLREGALGYTRFCINGECIAEWHDNDADAITRACVGTSPEQWFESCAGLTVAEFDRYYDRLHPYFDDPMGSIES